MGTDSNSQTDPKPQPIYSPVTCSSVKLAGEVTVLIDCNENPFKPANEMLAVVTGWATGKSAKKLREGVV